VTKTFPGMVRGTADPSAPPDFLSRVAASVNCMWFSLERTTYVVAGESGEAGNPGTLGMTKRKGWWFREEKMSNRSRFHSSKWGPSLTPGDERRPTPATTLHGALVPLPCHPERSRGICSSADLSWKGFSTGLRSRIPLRGPGLGRAARCALCVGHADRRIRRRQRQ
jgi:hypothetical protein